MTSPRVPSATIAVDANIILAIVLGLRTRRYFPFIASRRVVMTSPQTIDEVRRVITSIDKQAAERLAAVEDIADVLLLPSQAVEVAALEEARSTLRSAVASRNGSVADAHLLAVAWAYDADIWSHDRDFAGTGWPSWSTANLANALSEKTSDTSYSM